MSDGSIQAFAEPLGSQASGLNRPVDLPSGQPVSPRQRSTVHPMQMYLDPSASLEEANATLPSLAQSPIPAPENPRSPFLRYGWNSETSSGSHSTLSASTSASPQAFAQHHHLLEDTAQPQSSGWTTSPNSLQQPQSFRPQEMARPEASASHTELIPTFSCPNCLKRFRRRCDLKYVILQSIKPSFPKPSMLTSAFLLQETCEMPYTRQALSALSANLRKAA